MSDIKINKLEKLITSFLDTLDTSEKQEWYGTAQSVAEDFLRDFIGFAKRQGAIQEARILLENNGYTVED